MIELVQPNPESTMLPLLLASSSAYRRELLARLRLPFTWASPDIDEQRLADEPAVELVRRLARQRPKPWQTATQGI